jgi:hypothetical protein
MPLVSARLDVGRSRSRNSLCNRAHLDCDLLYRRDSIQFYRAVALADSFRVDLRHHRLRRHEFHRATALGSSTPTGRGHTHLTGQRGPGVDVLYRIASRAPGQKSTRSCKLEQCKAAVIVSGYSVTTDNGLLTHCVLFIAEDSGGLCDRFEMQS